MARTIGRLTALKVDKAKRPGMYADGGGLYLRVTQSGTKNWVFRFMLNGRPRWMGVGPLHTIGLAEARNRAAGFRLQRHDGVDPIERRRAERLEARLDAAKAVTFKECAATYIASHRAGWRNPKHAAQWEATLATYAEPMMGRLSVQAIDTALVLRVLEAIWTTKPETAGRLRGRIESILDWAKVRGYRAGENPARWRGHLDKLLPARSKVRRVEHHAALPYAELPGFLLSLREQEGIAARALEFAILTSARTGAAIGALWSEMDLVEKTWTLPAARMKAGREHRVPLSGRALAILQEMQPHRHSDEAFVFPGAKSGRPLSNMAFLMLLRRMGRGDVTAHGFRSSFRDWAAECTDFPAEVAEMALAHAVSDKTVAAYNRSDLFERRRRLMSDWTTYCTVPDQKAQSNVASLQKHSHQVTTVFDERAIEQIRASLPKGIDQRRLELILHEWSRTDLREHLSRESRATVRARYQQLSKIGTPANDLRQALEPIDQRGMSWIAQEMAREDGNPPFSMSREKLTEMKERLKDEGDFLGKLAPATVRLIEEQNESLSRRGQPRNIRAYLVMMDLVAIFEWLTGRKATREVDRDLGRDTGPFWLFAAAVWPHVFGKGCYGLSAAIKNWKEWHSQYGEESQFVRNMAMSHPDTADI